MAGNRNTVHEIARMMKAAQARRTREQRTKPAKQEREDVVYTDGPTDEARQHATYERVTTNEKGRIETTVWRRHSAIEEMVRRGTIDAGDKRILEQIAVAKQLIVQGVGYSSQKLERMSKSAERDWTSGQQRLVLTLIDWERECKRLSVDHTVATAVAVFDVSLSEVARLGLTRSRYIGRTTLLEGLKLYRSVAQNLHQRAQAA